jgi:hypothetical protein
VRLEPPQLLQVEGGQPSQPLGSLRAEPQPDHPSVVAVLGALDARSTSSTAL